MPNLNSLITFILCFCFSFFQCWGSTQDLEHGRQVLSHEFSNKPSIIILTPNIIYFIMIFKGMRCNTDNAGAAGDESVQR
jgi:hypothetical protein